jgi:CubicO group peptidase (beta-lactamase class C family)
LGFIIEDKLGPLDQVAEKRIFQPLAMKDTCYCPDQHGLTDRCAATEQKEGRGVIVGSCHDGKGWILNGVSGNAGLFSTANDIGRFACIMLNEGELDGHRVLKKESVDLLKHCYTEGLNLRRTLGWFSNDPNQTDGSHISSCCIYHTGFTGTSIYIDFVRSCAIVLLTNRVHPSRNNNAIMDLRRTIHDEALIAFDQGQWQ